MTFPWPQEADWPIGLHEHAAQLTKHLRDALLHLDREKDQPVPPDRVRMMVMAALSLVVKAQRTPDMTTVHDKIRTIHTELNQNAEGTAKELASIREELRNNMTGIQKSITIGEEAKTAAKEATDVGKTIAGMTREIKNKGPQYQAGTPTSYAAVAAQGALAASTYNTQRVKTPAPLQREIIVNIRNPQTTQSLRAMNPRNLKAHVDRAIAQSENEHIANIKIMSANQLKSGDLSIKTITNSEMQALRQFTEDWTPRLGNGTSVRNPTYGVLAHGIRTSTMNVKKFEETRDIILQDNKPFIPTADIKYIGWLTRRASNKTMSSVIIEFTRPEDANKIIDEGLVWQGEMCQCERYERGCRLKQCFQCQKYGHIGTQCKATIACGYCAQEHSSRECTSKTDRDSPRKCATCQGAHEAWSQQCPTRKEEMARTKAAYLNRAKYHPVVEVADPTTQPGNTTETLRRRRSARDLTAQQHPRTTRPSSPLGRGQKRTAPVDKENEPPNYSQRPQRTIIRSRRALEALENNTLARNDTQQMDIDDESDL